jgi:hypothetical protein
MHYLYVHGKWQAIMYEFPLPLCCHLSSLLKPPDL